MQRSRHMLPAPPWLPLGLDCRGPLTAPTHTLPCLALPTSGMWLYYWPPPRRLT